MGIYSLIYTLNSFGALLSKKDKKFIYIIVFGLLIFISGTRYYMGGTDVYAYESIYEATPVVSQVMDYVLHDADMGIISGYEKGFILFCSIAKTLNLTYWGFILVYASLFYVLLFVGIKPLVQEWSVFIGLFMYKIMFYNTFISLRQGMTIAIFCLSLRFILAKKFWKYMLCCLIAFGFHRGALILFLLYFVQYIPISKKNIFIFSLAFAPTWLIRDYVDFGTVVEEIVNLFGFSERSLSYTETTEPINIIHTLECYIIVILILYFYDQIIDYGEKAVLSLQMFCITLPIFTLLSNWIVLTREKDYFVLFYGVIIGYIVSNEKLESSTRKFVLGVSLLCGFIGMIRYVIVFDGGVLMNFTSFLSQNCKLFY